MTSFVTSLSGRRWAAPTLFTLLACAFYAPLLLGVRTFPDGDFTHHFLPYSLYLQESWRDGYPLPVWNPYTYSGHPFLADVQAAVFYVPAALLRLLTLPVTSPAAGLYFLQLEAVLHVVLAGAFTFMLVHRLTGSRRAALLSGVLFAFSGYLSGYPPLQLAILRTAVWLPLILWCLLRGFSQPRQWRWWIWGGAAYATALLAGHPQTFLHMSYAVLGWIAVLLLGGAIKGAPRTARWAAWRRPPPGLVTFYLVAAALSAVQWLPSLELMRYSVRAEVDYDFVSAGFPLHDTWQLLFPGVLTHFSPLYVGVAGLFLVPFAAAFGRRQLRERSSPRWAPAYFAVLTLLALLLSYGRNGFLFRLFYDYVPGWDLFRQQERTAYLVAFGLSVLAGYGLATIPSLPVRTRRGVAALLVAAVAAGALLFWPTLESPWELRSIFTLALSLALAAVLACLLWQADWTPALSVAVVVLAVANLFWVNGGVNLDPDRPSGKVALSPMQEAVREAVTERGTYGADGPRRVHNEFRLYENYGMRLGVEDVWGGSPLRIARYAALLEELPAERMWRLTGVQHVLTWRRELFGRGTRLAEFPQRDGTSYLHRLIGANPRAWLVHRTVISIDAVAAALLADPTFDLESHVVLGAESESRELLAAGVSVIDPEALELESGAQTGGIISAVQVRRLAPHRLQVSLQAGEGESIESGTLVVSENWMPGWRIESVRCAEPGHSCVPARRPLRANLSFLAVPVAAGPVTFELHYRPDSVRTGLLVSGATLLLLAATLLPWERLLSKGGEAANER